MRNEGAGFELQADAIDLTASQALAITGPSGCGKSTLIDLLALMRGATDCEAYRLMDVDVAALWRRRDFAACTRLRARHVGVVLQTGGLIACLSAFDNAMLGQRLLGIDDAGWVDRLFELLGISALRHRLPAQLSVGQRQRVAIARALAHRPALVLADEPTASLNRESADQVLQLLLGLARDGDCALLIASHDTEALQRHAIPVLPAATTPYGARFDAAPVAAPA